jgi:hypothetical protein
MLRFLQSVCCVPPARHCLSSDGHGKAEIAHAAVFAIPVSICMSVPKSRKFLLMLHCRPFRPERSPETISCYEYHLATLPLHTVCSILLLSATFLTSLLFCLLTPVLHYLDSLPSEVVVRTAALCNTPIRVNYRRQSLIFLTGAERALSVR